MSRLSETTRLTETAVDAIVLAGADNDGKLREVSSSPLEALIEIGGRPMAHHVLAALQAAGSIGRIVVVGPAGALADRLGGDGVEFAEPAGGIVENLEAGVAHLQPVGRVLLVTSDIPLVTAAIIDDFVRRCAEHEADLYYPLITREASEQQFPGIQRTYARLRDGTFTGGNCALLDPGILQKCRAAVQWAVEMRKKPWQISRVLGPLFTLKFLFGRLTVPDVERRISQVFGFRAKAVVSPYPEVGFDVDKPTDFALAQAVLAQRAGG